MGEVCACGGEVVDVEVEVWVSSDRMITLVSRQLKSSNKSRVRIRARLSPQSTYGGAG